MERREKATLFLLFKSRARTFLCCWSLFVPVALNVQLIVRPAGLAGTLDCDAAPPRPSSLTTGPASDASTTPVELTWSPLQSGRSWSHKHKKKHTHTLTSNVDYHILPKSALCIAWGGLKSDQYQISPATSPEILHHTVWRTWLFLAYIDARWIYYQFSLPHLNVPFKVDGRMYFLSLGVKGLIETLPVLVPIIMNVKTLGGRQIDSCIESTTNSHYLASTFLFRKVGRVYSLNLGVRGLRGRWDVALLRFDTTSWSGTSDSYQQNHALHNTRRKDTRNPWSPSTTVLHNTRESGKHRAQSLQVSQSIMVARAGAIVVQLQTDAVKRIEIFPV